MRAPGLFDLSDHLECLLQTGDPLEALDRHVDFEAFRSILEDTLEYGDRPKGGRPPYGAATMFTVQVLASLHNLSDERMEFPIRDRLSRLRFPGFQIGETTPDEKTIWLFREKLTQAGAFRSLFAAFEDSFGIGDTKPAGGRIVDTTPVAAPRRRIAEEEKKRVKAGESAAEIWPDNSAKASLKDTNARWTVRYSKIRKTEDGEDDADIVDIAVLRFGYNNRIPIDRKWRFIRGENRNERCPLRWPRTCNGSG